MKSVVDDYSSRCIIIESICCYCNSVGTMDDDLQKAIAISLIVQDQKERVLDQEATRRNLHNQPTIVSQNVFGTVHWKNGSPYPLGPSAVEGKELRNNASN